MSSFISRAIVHAGIAALSLTGIHSSMGQTPLFTKPAGVATRWSSFENSTAEAGQGARENQGGKGHAFDMLQPGECKTLLDIKGSGMITRIWMTVDDRSTETLRSLKLNMYWDGAQNPAVSVPLGDFFGAMQHTPTAYQNELFANPEGRSFNCYIPMPFWKSARVTLTNETTQPLKHLFYDVNCLTGVTHSSDTLYFHAIWRREKPTHLGQDFEILPRIKGKGRFLGSNICVIVDPKNKGWWGEGEVKMYLDGDTTHPTLVGTGSEDYIGTGWGQGVFATRYQGCFVSDSTTGQYSFYRYHVPDAVYFEKDARVTIQQIGGTSKKEVLEMLAAGRPVKPVSIDKDGHFKKLLEPPTDLAQEPSPEDTWCNFYREDDVCAVAFFYLDKAENGLPALQPVSERTALSR